MGFFAGRYWGTLDVELALFFPLKIELFSTKYLHMCSIDLLALDSYLICFPF